MELGRWGFDKITSISDRYREFRNFLADVLEGDRSLIHNPNESAEVHEPFLVRNDFDSLLSGHQTSRGKDSVARELAVFRHLAPFFEAGFLLRPDLPEATPTGASEIASSTAPELTLESMFLFGKVFVPPTSEAPRVQMKLPSFEGGRVYRGRIGAVLKVFRIDTITSLHEGAAFLFALKSGSVFLLLCNRPHLWQVTAIERAHETVQMLIAKGK